MAVVVHFVSDDWKLQQQLVQMQMLSKSLAGEEIARELTTVPSVTCSIHPHKLLGDMRDEASVNCVAMQTVKVIYPSLVDITCRCFLHTTDNVGDKFKTAILSKFTTCMNGSFCPQP